MSHYSERDLRGLRMSRRRVQETRENHERWLVSYADFITLLFAFFVVMYSMSSVNEGKYRILSDNLSSVFNAQKQGLDPIQVGSDSKSVNKDMIELPQVVDFSVDKSLTNSTDNANEETEDSENLDEIARSMEAEFSAFVDEGLINVKGNELWVEVELKSKILFDSGFAQPNQSAYFILKTIADILKKYPNPIHVEGFTDNIPINNEEFRSNWELSAGRAASMVRVLTEHGVDPNRLAAVGYGEFQPITDNTTPEARAANRRVVLIVSRDLNVRRSITAVSDKNNIDVQGLSESVDVIEDNVVEESIVEAGDAPNEQTNQTLESQDNVLVQEPSVQEPNVQEPIVQEPIVEEVVSDERFKQAQEQVEDF